MSLRTKDLAPDERCRRFVLTEVAISTVLSGVLPATAMWFFAGPFPMAMWGSDGFAGFLLRNTMGMATVMTLIMTLAVRRRIRLGTAPSDASGGALGRWIRFLPRPVLLRAPALGLGALLLFYPIALCVALALHFDGVGRPAFVLFNAVLGGLIGCVLTPIILAGAMSDPVGRQTANA